MENEQDQEKTDNSGRGIPLYTWWLHKHRTLPVVVVANWGITASKKISLLRIGSSNPTQMEAELFWQLIDNGEISPYVHNEKEIPTTAGTVAGTN